MASSTPRSSTASVALFSGGFVTFSLLYSVQPLLPTLSSEFGVHPATSSLALSVTTGALAVSMVGAAAFADRTGRRPVMVLSVLSSSVVGLTVPLFHDFPALLAARLLLGILLAGLPAVAMAYLAEEVHPSRLGAAMGVYIAGNAVGGMSGRLTIGLLTDAVSWRRALAIQAALCLAVSLWFALKLPPSRNFKPVPVDLGTVRASFRRALTDPALFPVFGVAFILMASFASLYNYIAFLLMREPYSLSHSAVGWIFLLYLVGTVSSATMGRMADRMGKGTVLAIGIAVQAAGALVTLSPLLPVMILGLALFTFGFFGAHATASGWVGARSGAVKATAATVYLLAYYCGSSLGGYLGGFFWTRLHWRGVVLMSLLLLGTGLFLAKKASQTD
ncbi:MAG: MFS transporter [Thermoanaerobaculia bacterium]|nr:MFS transporter [Thermoanaerobaculia bacterium]